VCVFFSSAVPLLFAVIVSFLLVLLHFGEGEFRFFEGKGGERVWVSRLMPFFLFFLQIFVRSFSPLGSNDKRFGEGF
jgi:hypothetical protein